MELCSPFTPCVPAFVLSQKACLLYFPTCPSSHSLLSGYSDSSQHIRDFLADSLGKWFSTLLTL